MGDDRGHDGGRGPGAAVVLLSGGLDSATCLAIARDAGHTCHALTFEYGQRHSAEVRSACALARSGAVASHLVVALPAEPFAASTLTGGGPLPPDRGEGAQGQGAPSTYVPARNLVFLSLAVAHAETLGAQSVWVGVNAMDYSGYPDCRPAFLDAFERAAALATRAGTEAERPVRVRAPLVSMRKADIVRRAADLGVDLALTTSCYAARWERGGPVACGRCEACGLRRRGFASAGVPDPTSYGGAAV